MTLVVDASVIVAALIDNGPTGQWAEQQLAGEQLIAPALMRTEATNVLRRAELAQQIDPATAALAFADLCQLAMQTAPFEMFADRMWQLRPNITSYDASYIACAEIIGVPLATLDIRLTQAPGPTCVFLTPQGLGEDPS